MTRPRLLDLFCGAGGAAVGYDRAGFEVIGVDIAPQPRYPFEFHQADALTFPLEGFDVIHASPPCQGYLDNLNALNRSIGRGKDHPKLIEPARARLLAWGGPYVLENIVGAPLLDPIRLCGSSFGLPLRRHRLFEGNMLLMGLPCAHGGLPKRWPVPLGSPSNIGGPRLSRFVAVYGSTRYRGELADRRMAMGVDWMTKDELNEAIPPAYAEFIGGQLVDRIGARNVASAQEGEQ